MSQTSKRKRRSKTVPVLSAAGLSLSLASGAAIATPTPSLDTITRNARESHENILREEEICDVSLATFCVFDKERAGAFRAGERLIKVSGCCLFACLAGQSSTGFEGTSAPGNNAYSPPAPRPIMPTHKHVRKKRKTASDCSLVDIAASTRALAPGRVRYWLKSVSRFRITRMS